MWHILIHTYFRHIIAMMKLANHRVNFTPVWTTIGNQSKTMQYDKLHETLSSCPIAYFLWHVCYYFSIPFRAVQCLYLLLTFSLHLYVWKMILQNIDVCSRITWTWTHFDMRCTKASVICVRIQNVTGFFFKFELHGWLLAASKCELYYFEIRNSICSFHFIPSIPVQHTFEVMWMTIQKIMATATASMTIATTSPPPPPHALHGIEKTKTKCLCSDS